MTTLAAATPTIRVYACACVSPDASGGGSVHGDAASANWQPTLLSKPRVARESRLGLRRATSDDDDDDDARTSDSGGSDHRDAFST